MYKLILQGNLHHYDWGGADPWKVEFDVDGDGIYAQFNCHDDKLPDDAVERLKAASKTKTPVRIVITILDDVDEDTDAQA